MYSYSVCDYILKNLTGVICPVDFKHPFIKIEEDPYLKGSNIIHCYGCMRQYNLVHYVAMARNQSVIEACKDINALLGSKIATIPALSINAPVFKRNSSLPSISLEPSDYWLSRGISAETQAFFGAGDAEGKPTVPIYSPDEDLVGVIQRNPDWPTDVEATDTKDRKYIMSGSVRGELLGIKQARSLNLPYRAIVEGPVDVMNCYQAGIPALAINNNALSLRQIDIISKETDTLIIATDNDDHGNFFMRSKGFKMFVQPFFKFERLTLPVGKDPGSMTSEELKVAMKSLSLIS